MVNRSSNAPRGWLGSSAGVFSLADSNRTCGSYIALDDAARILQVREDALRHLPTTQIGSRRYFTDKVLGRAWASGQLDASPRAKLKQGTAAVSFDELIVLTLFELALP